jgi:multiple sugar transport system ATP-binding protein
VPEIVLKDITKRFGKSVAVDRLNMTIADGDFVTLLGPSGCGKTTTLRMIAGLESPTEGEIQIAGRTVFCSRRGIDIAPDKREIGFLFQNYALWPHMTVEKNIAFGLENLKWDKPRIQARVGELLDKLKITQFSQRYPSELSGGQQQRVAIARTLATEPKVLFMDEPLSNLDAKLRTEMRTELKRLHGETKSTFVFVTHDQLEAMTLSTRACLMKDGHLQQYAPPLEIYHAPANLFVADFVGSPTMNFIEGTVAGVQADVVRIGTGGAELVCARVDAGPAVQVGQSVVVGIRPEYLRISPEGQIRARVYSTLPSGMETVVRLDVAGQLLTSVAFGAIDFQVDSAIGFDIIEDRCVLFDSKSTRNLGRGTLQMNLHAR